MVTTLLPAQSIQAAKDAIGAVILGSLTMKTRRNLLDYAALKNTRLTLARRPTAETGLNSRLSQVLRGENSARIAAILRAGISPASPMPARRLSASDVSGVGSGRPCIRSPYETAGKEATVLGDVENPQILQNTGANVNATASTWKYTQLFLAIIQNDVAVVRKMLKQGADVNAKDSTGSTPFMWAAYSEVNDLTVLNMLRAAGADINAKNHYGETALTWARRNGDTSLVQLLTQWGAQ